MATNSKSANQAGQISALRAFNRFYTARLGLLRKRHLDGEFSLTEARILYEIASTPGLTARALCEMLELDAGYMSRLLAVLTKRGLVRQTLSKNDGRHKLLSLSPTGKNKVAGLDRESARQIKHLLEPLSISDRKLLVDSLNRAGTILAPRREPTVQVVRVQKPDADVLNLLNEYFEAVHVILRDSPAAVRRLLAEAGSGMWVAYLNGKAVGCVVVHRLESIATAAECKRLYVRPEARGHGIAEMLMDALEAHVREQGFKWVYLDTHDGLKPAIALYRKRGYRACKRYNENPQATVFFRKKL